MNIKEHNHELYEDLVKRMKRIEGQARGIQRMLEEGDDCEQVVVQLSAMKSAIHRVGMKAVACSMSKRISDALQKGDDPAHAADEVIDQFLKLG